MNFFGQIVNLHVASVELKLFANLTHFVFSGKSFLQLSKVRENEFSPLTFIPVVRALA